MILCNYLNDKLIDELTKHHVLDLNNRPFQAIKEKKKKVEYRTNTKYSAFDFGLIKAGDIIQFVNEINGDKLEVRVTRVSHYKTTRDLFESEGLANSSLKPESIEVAVERLESFTGYEEGIKLHGIRAIEFELINNL